MKILRSLLDPTVLAATVEANYSLTNVRCELIKPGVNDTYRVWADEANAVLRVSPANDNPNDRRAHEIEATFLLSLAQASVPVITPYTVGKQPPSGMAPAPPHYALWLDTPEGERAAMLFTLAPGQTLSAVQTIDAVANYGEALAQLHTAADATPLPPSYLSIRPHWDADGLVRVAMRSIADRLSHRPDNVTALQQVADTVSAHLETFPQDTPLWGPIHADTDASNAFVDANSAITLIDFDYFGVGPRVYDLASFIDELRVYWPKRADYEGAFITGYKRVRKIQAAEYDALPYLLAARKLFVLSLYTRHLDVWGRFRLTDRYINGIVKRAQGYLATPR